jgi:microcystin degradation protein MlrC
LLVDNATVITGYKTYPHVDMYDAGMLSGRHPRSAQLDGAVEPVMAWGWRPLIAS